MTKITTIAATIMALGASAGAAADSAGRVLALAGNATVERSGQQVPLSAGASVESGDVLAVGDRSTLQVRFTDESVVALRANSQFRIENYKFDKNSETDRSVLGLIKGGMRTITGLIGKANTKNYMVQTATATIGIRGTHFLVVSCNNDCVRPDGSREPNGTFGGVTDGRITVSNGAGSKEFGQQDYFHVPSSGSPPVQLLAPPAILSDRGLQARGRTSAEGGAQAAGASSGSGRGSGANTSTSPQLVVQQSPVTDLNAPLTTVASADQPAILKNAGLGSGNITVVEGKGYASTGGIFMQANARNYTVTELRSQVPELAGAYFSDAATLYSAGQQRIPNGIFGSSAAAAAYWIYEPPSSSQSNDVGSHHAFGDTPLMVLPASGIAQYNYAGGTAPTDNYGRVGSFGASNLTMNFGSQQISNNSAMTFSFGTNARQATATVYNVPANTSWSMTGGVQTLAGSSCTTGCLGTTTASVNGQFVGAAMQGYTAAFAVTNTQLNTAQNNGVSSVAAFAKQ